MATFRFLHAADLHIDSPLIGLATKSEELASRVDDASRRALDNLVELAIDEECRFVVIAGDLFDGQWRDYRTGRFFADRMRRLDKAGIRAFIVLGNHDAENRFASRLEFSGNVRLLSHRNPESILIDGLDAVVHGLSFPERHTRRSIAADYPAPAPGRFNIGLLHTSCAGHDGHAPYAPCTVEQLVNHGYDYWALGHIHTHEVLHREPFVVYPGNLQGRHARECGPKGAVLVTVNDGDVVDVEHRQLDVVRWSVETVNLEPQADMSGVHALVREHVQRAVDKASGRGVALRLRLCGATSAHGEVATHQARLQEEIETIAAAISDEIWIEKVEIATTPQIKPDRTDPSIAGRIRSIVEEMSSEPQLAALLETKLIEIREKFPAAAHADELFDAIRAEGSHRALMLALAIIERERE